MLRDIHRQLLQTSIAAILFGAVSRPAFAERLVPAYDVSSWRDTIVKSVTIDSLQTGQLYCVNLKSTGCFHDSRVQLRIFRDANGYVAGLRVSGTVEHKTIKSRRENVRLTLNQIDAIRSFEKGLFIRSMKKEGCTTEDFYTVSIGARKWSVMIDDCAWDGINQVLKPLFGKSDKSSQ